MICRAAGQFALLFEHGGRDFVFEIRRWTIGFSWVRGFFSCHATAVFPGHVGFLERDRQIRCACRVSVRHLR